MKKGTSQGNDGSRCVNGYPSEQRKMLAAMRKGSEMCCGRMREEDDGKSGYLPALERQNRTGVLATRSQSHLSSSLSFSTSKVSSQPTSTRILMPPSSSRSDCDAGDVDCAPSRDVKLNIVAALNRRLHAEDGPSYQMAWVINGRIDSDDDVGRSSGLER